MYLYRLDSLAYIVDTALSQLVDTNVQSVLFH